MQKNEKIKICMFVERFPPVYSGAAKQALCLANSLRKKGVEIFFLISRIVDETPAKDTVNGFPVYRIPFSGSGKIKKVKAVLKIFILFIKNRNRFDILHLHGCHYLMLGIAFLAKLIGKKVVIKLTLIDFDTPDAIRNGKYGRIAYYFYKKVYAIVCISSAQYNICLKYNLPERKLFKIPNGVNLNEFYPLKELSEKNKILKLIGLPESFRYITFVGLVEKRKNIDLLIDIWAEVIERCKNSMLLIVGPDGRSGVNRRVIKKRYVDEIRKKIERKHLSKSVIFTGKVDNVQDYLRISDLFIFPSKNEGLPTALIEAMACGLPPVVLDIPGVTKDIISSTNEGVVIESEDVGVFVDEISRLLGDSKKRVEIGRAARRKVLETFDLECVADQYLSLYKSL